MMFGDVKHKNESGYNAEIDLPIQGILNAESMKTVVESIFRKAQNEKEYCSFYGDLCERIIRLELQLRGLDLVWKNLKLSEFRTALLEYCKGSFDKFFD
jgi:hypothetical protein